MRNLPNIAQLCESATYSALPIGMAASLAIKFYYRKKGLQKNLCRSYITEATSPPSHHPLEKLLIQPSKLNSLLINWCY